MSAPRLKDAAPTTPRRRLAIVPSSPVETLLARLECVRKSGRGYTARCPAHKDRTASLSITAGDDGRVLLNCFVGCRAADVVTAAGLSLADLFVKRPSESMTFAERAALREYGRQAQWRAALNVTGFEAKIVLAAAGLIHKRETLTADDLRRLAEAVHRIDNAREVLCAQSS